MKRWQAVVFDMDDTLYPEQMYVRSGFRAVAEWGAQELGIDAATGYAQLEALFMAGVRRDTFNRWMMHFELIDPQADDGTSEAVVASLVERYRRHMPTLQPFPEAAVLIPQLARRYHLGLVSDGYLSVQRRKWDALQLAQHFDAVVFSDQWGSAAWKPNVQPFQEVLRLLNVQPEQAVYIGDNPLKDFLGAREIGMATIWLKRDHGEYSRQEPPTAAHAPNQIVTSWAALQSVLLQ